MSHQAETAKELAALRNWSDAAIIVMNGAADRFDKVAGAKTVNGIRLSTQVLELRALSKSCPPPSQPCEQVKNGSGLIAWILVVPALWYAAYRLADLVPPTPIYGEEIPSYENPYYSDDPPPR